MMMMMMMMMIMRVAMMMIMMITISLTTSIFLLLFTIPIYDDDYDEYAADVDDVCEVTDDEIYCFNFHSLFSLTYLRSC
jgi:hypothetical protein